MQGEYRYKVKYKVISPTRNIITTHQFVSADNPGEAYEKVGKYYKPPIEIEIIDFKQVEFTDEFILELWYAEAKDEYLHCWNPDIYEDQMIECMKTTFPNTYRRYYHA